jgi:hypothetical protein
VLLVAAVAAVVVAAEGPPGGGPRRGGLPQRQPVVPAASRLLLKEAAAAGISSCGREPWGAATSAATSTSSRADNCDGHVGDQSEVVIETTYSEPAVFHQPSYGLVDVATTGLTGSVVRSPFCVFPLRSFVASWVSTDGAVQFQLVHWLSRPSVTFEGVISISGYGSVAIRASCKTMDYFLLHNKNWLVRRFLKLSSPGSSRVSEATLDPII